MSSLFKCAAALLAASMLMAGAGADAQAVADSREQAQAVIEQGQRDAAEVGRRYEQALRECDKDFFVNPCRERVRQERDEQLRAIREREVAARDVLRRLDAEERASARARREQEKAVGSGERTVAPGTTSEPTRPLPSAAPPKQPKQPKQPDEAAASQREEAARQRAQDEARRAAERAKESERRAAEQAGKAARSGDEIERYEERQRAAQARAEEKKKLAEEKRQRRERRAQERSAAGQPPANPAQK